MYCAKTYGILLILDFKFILASTQSQNLFEFEIRQIDTVDSSHITQQRADSSRCISHIYEYETTIDSIYEECGEGGYSNVLVDHDIVYACLGRGEIFTQSALQVKTGIVR